MTPIELLKAARVYVESHASPQGADLLGVLETLTREAPKVRALVGWIAPWPVLREACDRLLATKGPGWRVLDGADPSPHDAVHERAARLDRAELVTWLTLTINEAEARR